ncbi:HEPN domain-containing protein [Siphonobacter aquaeclarae]|uniref:Uncharacterized protein n=1 Tax=Siphonobacter aquaeclarae TaxID=563176 RepID=A0A1G9T0Y7_9BACT|nr:HEPN domain-containing protein [Siphonobacter aquaeclarae]SDM41310.1 hypothetical protein SAMN04488090_3369 [Siphonobacter aquaeclarae]
MIDHIEAPGKWKIPGIDGELSGTLFVNEDRRELIVHYDKEYPIWRTANFNQGRDISHITGRSGKDVYHLFNSFFKHASPDELSKGVFTFFIDEVLRTSVDLPPDFGYDPKEEFPFESFDLIKNHEDNFIDKIYLKFNQLSRWIPFDGYKGRNKKEQYLLSISVKVSLSPVSTFYFDNTKIEIKNFVDYTLDTNISIERSPYFIITFPEKRNLKFAIKTVYKLIYFNSLITGMYLIPEETTIVQTNNESKKKIYYSYISVSAMKDKARHRLENKYYFIQFNSLKRTLHKIAKSYNEVYTQLSGSFSILYDTTDEINIDIRNVIFKIASYLESSERECQKYPSQPEGISTLTKVHKALTEEIRKSTLEKADKRIGRKKFQDLMLSKLSHFKDKNFKARISTIMDVIKLHDVDSKIKDDLGLERKDFINKVANIRNDIAHAKVDILERYTFNELVSVYFHCHQILRLFLLDLIGINKKNKPKSFL